MRLARPCLPVHKVGPIVTVKDVHDERQSRLLKDLKLGAIGAEGLPEDEVLAGLLQVRALWTGV